MASGEILSILVMLNNYFHDLAVGTLFANVLLTLFLVRLLKEHGGKTDGLREALIRFSGRITWTALAFIIAGGLVRTATYRNFEWAEAAGRGQVAALIVKHVILVGCTAVGVALQVRLSRKYSETRKAAAKKVPLSC